MSDSSDSSFSEAWGLRGIDDDLTEKSQTGETDTKTEDLKVTIDQKLKEGISFEKKMILLQPEAKKISVPNGVDWVWKKCIHFLFYLASSLLLKNSQQDN